MKNDMGLNIRQLRLAKNMTQEQLGEKLSLSAQSVSKWENGVTLPDIQLLPELSVILGVTIDELFTLTDETRFERIDNMLFDVRFLSDADFAQTERFLKEKYGEEATRAKAALLLAQLYNKRADEYHQLAAPLAKRALLDNPDSKDAHNAIFDSDNGAYMDWNFTNHHKLIDWYKGFIRTHEDNFKAYLWLLDLLLADGRCAEAREYAEAMNRMDGQYHYLYYMSRICRAEGDFKAAEEWLEKLLNDYPDSWLTYVMYADEMAKQCRYDEAIEFYQKARPLRPQPPFVDCEEAMAHIYEIKGDYEKAISMYEAIIEMMKTQWNETEGEGIDLYLREIERLKKKKA